MSVTDKQIELLYSKNNTEAYEALKELQNMSSESDEVYAHLDEFISMLNSDNSYLRSRGLTLIAANVKWDHGKKIDSIIDSYLQHITDVKPITSRLCIKTLPELAESKPELKNKIISALQNADLSEYKDSMRPLIRSDIETVLEKLTKNL